MSGPSGEQIEIAFRAQRAVVVEVGGGLRSYSGRGGELLDGFSVDEPIASGRGQVLIPWPNRIEDGAYEFDGRSYQLLLTEPEHRNAIHGLVRDQLWTVGAREPHRVVMEHALEPTPGYPFALDLAVEYALSESGLSVRTTATNVGEKACPFGSGQHPYVMLGTARVDSLILSAPGQTILTTDEREIPRGRKPVAGTEYDFRRPREIGATRLDHAFTDLVRGPDGRARIELRDPRSRKGLSVWLDEAYGYLQLFTGDPLPDVARRSLAVEPMTCPANAFRTGEALVRLEPGESFTGAWGIVP